MQTYHEKTFKHHHYNNHVKKVKDQKGEVEKLYKDVLDGKYDLTKQNPSAGAEIASFGSLFTVYYGDDSPEFKAFTAYLEKIDNKTDMSFLQGIKLLDHTKLYRNWKDNTKGLNFSVSSLPDNCTIMFFADFGTGLEQADDLLKKAMQVVTPDIIIHVGDTYYSGDKTEYQKYFIDLFDKYVPKSVKVYYSPGNHDYYSGGEGYYWMLDYFKVQEASYFCLENENWTFVGMDTAFYDAQPNYKKATCLRDEELEWVKDKLDKEKRKLLFSHHQLWTYNDNVGTSDDGKQHPVAINYYNQLKDYLPKIDLFYWAHEHNFCVYDEYLGLKKSRLIGHGSCPKHDCPVADLYKPNEELDTSKFKLPKLSDGNWKLKNNGKFSDNGFVVFTLNGKQAHAKYYEIPSPTANEYEKPMCTFEEDI